LTGLLFAAVGVCEGIVWWLVGPFDLESVAGARLSMSLLFFTSSAALVGRLIWTGASILRCAAVAAATGLVACLVTLAVWGHLPPAGAAWQGDDQRVAAWVICAFAFLYVVTPFAQIFQRTGRARFPYPDLFEHSWNNFFVGLVAAAFTGALWAVLGVWGALFDLVEISAFRELFTSASFAYPCTFGAFGYGLSVGRSSEGVIATLRRITLMAGRTLLPLVAFVAILFAAALPFTGLDPLWATGRATPLTLVLLALLAVFLNAVFEDGSRGAPYPSAVRVVVEASICLMPLYAAIAVYGTSLRVAQYGLTPQRIYALLFGAIAAMYALGYAAAVIARRPPWIGWVKSVNVGAALVVAAIAILVQLWPLDPLRLSAESQARRLEQGRVAAADFDFAALRFRLGHHGWAELERLEALREHPEALQIASAIAEVRASAYAWTAAQEPPGDPKAMRFGVLPEGTPVPPAALEAMGRGHEDLGRGLCVSEADGCLVLAPDLDGDGDLELCLLARPWWSYAACYERTRDAEWTRIGSLGYRGVAEHPDTAQIGRWYRGAAALPTRAGRFRELAVPDGALYVVPDTWVDPDATD
jgi:hypothetical protein